MYQDLLKTNVDGILDWKSYFDYFAIMGQIKLKWTQSEISVQTKGLESRLDLNFVALLGYKTSSDENVRDSQFLPNLRYETVNL